MSETATDLKLNEQEQQLIIATLQYGLQPLTREQIQITKAHLSASYQAYVSLKQLPKPLSTTDLMRDTEMTVKRLRRTTKDLQALHDDSFPGNRAIERTAQSLKVGDEVWSLRDQVVGFLNTLADSLVTEMSYVLGLRKEKFLVITAEQALVEDLIRLWCKVQSINRHEIRPGSADKPGPLVRFLQSATAPVRKRLRLRLIPFHTLRDMAAKVKKAKRQERVRRSVQKK